MNQSIRDRLHARLALAVAGSMFAEPPKPVEVNGAPPPEILLNAVNMKPVDAIKYFEQKGYKLTWSWKAMDGAAHAQAFTVAKVMKLDILISIRDAMQKAIDEGQTLQTFRHNLEPTLKAKGWWGRKMSEDVPHDPGHEPPSGAGEVQLGSPWRLATIYRTNMQTSYMVGRYKGQMAASADRPYLQYIAILDAVTRPDHAAMNGRVFLHDDPIWDTWQPPAGYNCRCRTRSLSESDLERYGLTGRVESTNGSVMGPDDKPLKPDEGWDYNPAKEGLDRLEEMAAQKADDLGVSIEPTPEPATQAQDEPSAVPMGSMTKAVDEWAPASSIPEAEDFARSNVADTVDYRGMDLEAVNEINQTMTDAIREYPELRQEMEFVGSVQERNHVALGNEIEKNRARWEAEGMSRSTMERAARETLRSLDPGLETVYQSTIAQSSDHDGIRGISFNRWWFNPVRTTALSEELEAISNEIGLPVDCASVRFVVNHEIGHRLTTLAYADEDVDVVRLAQELFPLTTPREAIANAIAESMTTSHPRAQAVELARLVGRLPRGKP